MHGRFNECDGGTRNDKGKKLRIPLVIILDESFVYFKRGYHDCIRDERSLTNMAFAVNDSR